MENKIITNVWLAMIIVCIVLVAGFSITGNGISEDKVKDIVADEMSKLSIPTAEEISSGIIVPSIPEFEIPEFKADEKVNDLWENLYSAVIEEIKEYAELDAQTELEDEEFEALEDYLKLNIVNFDEIEYVDFEEVEIEVLNIGLDEEDKVAEVVFELEVEYTLTEGPINDVFEDTIFVTASVVYDEGDFEEEEVELTFALE